MDKQRETQIYQWLKSQQTPGKKWLELTSFFGILHGLLMVCQAALLAWIISNIVTKHIDPQTTLLPLGLLAMVVLAKAGSQWGKEVFGFKGGRAVREDLRQRLLKKISTQGPVSLNQQTTGQWVTLLQERIDQVQEFYSHYLPQLRMMSTLPLIIGAITFGFNWAVGCIFLITAPLVPIFMILVGNKAAESNRKNFVLLSRLSNHFLDRIRGLSTLRLLNRSKAERTYVANAANGFRIQTMRVLRLAFLSSAVLEFFASISIALTAMYLGMSYLGYLNFGGWGHSLTLFTGFFLLLLAPEFYQSLRDLGTHYHARAQAIGASDTVMAFLDSPNIIPDSGKTLLENPEQITLSCQNLIVKSSDGTPLLNNISFTLNAGEHLAIAGASGSGKSTLLKTLMGFYPYEGNITVNGQELRTLDSKSYRSQIAWLSQNPLLVYGSAEDNVRLGTEVLTEENIDTALNQAHAAEFIQHLPEGKKTLLGEGSSRISVGQAQRIALARTLARKGNLVLMDEPTASLDKHSESIINDQLKHYTQHRSVLIATHRLNQLATSDRVLLLDHGQLIEQGTFNELVVHSPLFKHLWQEWQSFDQDSALMTDLPSSFNPTV